MIDKTCCAACGKPADFFDFKTSDNKNICRDCSVKANIPYPRSINDAFPSLDEVKKMIDENKDLFSLNNENMPRVNTKVSVSPNLQNIHIDIKITLDK